MLPLNIFFLRENFGSKKSVHERIFGMSGFSRKNEKEETGWKLLVTFN